MPLAVRPLSAPCLGWIGKQRRKVGKHMSKEPRDAGMAGLLEVGARHGGLPRRIGVRPQMDAGYDETDSRQRAMHTEAVGRFIPIANCHIRVWLPLAGFGPDR